MNYKYKAYSASGMRLLASATTIPVIVKTGRLMSDEDIVVIKNKLGEVKVTLFQGKEVSIGKEKGVAS